MKFVYICNVKHFVTKIGTYMLAAVLVLSTTSFTVHKHFCGSFLVDVSVVVPSPGCGMERVTVPAASGCEQVLAPGCCNDKQELVQGQDTLKLDFSTFDFAQPFVAPVYTNWFIEAPVVTLAQPSFYDKHGPPIVQRHLYILHDSFLI